MPRGLSRRAVGPLPTVLLTVFAACLAACGPAEDAPPAALGELPAESYDPVLARELAVGTLAGEDPSASVEPLRRAVAMNDGLADGWLLLASAYAELGQDAAAVDALLQLAELGIRPPIEAFESLGTLQDPRLEEFGQRLRRHLEPAGASETVFTLPDRDLVTEGIAHDPESGAYFVSSVHRRKIVRRDADGTVRDLLSHETGAEDGDGVYGVFGLAWDAERNRLWAVTSTIRQMRGFEEERDLESALLAVDPDTGEILERHDLPQGHRLNDLVLADDGTVYVSDNQPPGALFRLAPGGDALEPMARDVVFRSPQGLALVDGPGGEEILVVADYSYGLVALDTASGESWYVEPPSLTWMQTLDGLTRVGPDALVASQNGGYPPHRISRLRLSADRRSVESVEVLAKALPEWDEPTLGTFVRGEEGEPDRWVYVARSQWGRFGPEGEILPTDQLRDGLVMSVALE